MAQERIIESRQWEAYAEENKEKQAINTKTEVELWHHGSVDLFFAKLRKVSSYYHDGSGMVAETWEAMTRRDIPQRFTVFLHKGTLDSHLQLCKYRETDHGQRLIQRLGYIAMILLYIPLLSSLAGMLPTEIDLLQWYWFGPICAVAGMFGTLLWYNHASVCQRLVLECACPELEQGGHHYCYITQSKTANVLEQLNALDRNRPFIHQLITGLLENGSSRVVDLEDTVMRLEYEADQRDLEVAHQVARNVNRRLWLGQGPQANRMGISPAVVVTVVAIVAVAVGLIMTYMKGA